MQCGRCTAEIPNKRTVCVDCKIAYPRAAMTKVRLSRWKSRREKRALVRDLLWALFFGCLGFAYASHVRLPQQLMTIIILVGAVGGALLAYIPPGWRDTIERRRVGSRLRRHLLELNAMVTEENEKWEKVLREAADDGSAHAELGVIAYINEDFPGSAVSFSRALECDPQNRVALLNLGAAYDQQGRDKDARGAFEASVASDGDPLRRANLGLYYR